jgi:EamA domain-containing membrane protein RarD
LKKGLGILFLVISSLFGIVFMLFIKGALNAVSVILSTGFTYDSAAGLVLSITILAIPGLLVLYFSRQAKKFLQHDKKADSNHK